MRFTNKPIARHTENGALIMTVRHRAFPNSGMLLLLRPYRRVPGFSLHPDFTRKSLELALTDFGQRVRSMSGAHDAHQDAKPSTPTVERPAYTRRAGILDKWWGAKGCPLFR
ncbi:hypothetical protein MGAST_20530 [Mycobacterium gastri 'Wayne']|nr:hypothetical protein MGAST_20530 [Mycobacterium gastri 'Wayne']